MGHFYRRQTKKRKNHSRSIWMVDINVCIFIFTNLPKLSYKVIEIWLLTIKDGEDNF